MMEHPALKNIMREVAKEDGLLNLAETYNGEVYTFPRRRGKSYTPSGAKEKIIGPSRIATLRKRSGLTQRKVAEIIGINSATLSDIERKKLVATQEQKGRILSFYDVGARYYFDGENGLAK